MLSSRAVATRRIRVALQHCGYVVIRITWSRQGIWRGCDIEMRRDGQAYGTTRLGLTYGSVARQVENTYYLTPEDWE